MHDATPQRWLLPTIRFLFAILVLWGLTESAAGRLYAQEGKVANPAPTPTKEETAPPPSPAQKPAESTAKPQVTDKPQVSEAPAAAQRDPLKQLSRQYARRKSPQNLEDHRPPTPPSADEIHEPVLAFSQGHRETCIAYVGDALPEGTLPDGEGKSHGIRESFGKRLTVIICWNADNPYALDQFQEIRRDVLPLAEQGVQAIAIHVGAPPADYTELCRESGESVLCLLDADRAYFGQLANRMLPRTYVVDTEGKILWLDIEYSRSTRYDLRNALHFYLQK